MGRLSEIHPVFGLIAGLGCVPFLAVLFNIPRLSEKLISLSDAIWHDREPAHPWADVKEFPSDWDANVPYFGDFGGRDFGANPFGSQDKPDKRLHKAHFFQTPFEDDMETGGMASAVNEVFYEEANRELRAEVAEFRYRGYGERSA